MANTWSTRSIIQVVIVGTGCICLMAIVLGCLILAVEGSLNANTMGAINAAGVGTGFLGLAKIVSDVIKFGKEKA